ncbi:peptide-methionine (R)-S-oxide reductase MsrB [Aquimarina sp. ERC-38]|uniref:peptide-methionine (R)-S-oxide reductase MsrB n=1 Tax=Aquimarina sp. ERC-38 TaxID=2949996 RepID=UPI0022456456|nr:peptide-methionine (R)-S-oxide reductase MsrB [Aquimarina sp. ERC-38]UZO79815.1 peptide-methionine (R)-S-oxide reductase MsrB [Aquimarina sp. ERC-38]
MKHILAGTLLLLFISCNGIAQKGSEKNKEARTFKVEKTTEEWKEVLTNREFYILRQAGTEVPFSSPLNNIKEAGTFVCAGCQSPLYKTKYKFDSGTGWPSFDRPVEDAVITDVDHKLGYARTELLCATCGGHLGHVFSDGPRETTGKRHCINGDALHFKPETE